MSVPGYSGQSGRLVQELQRRNGSLHRSFEGLRVKQLFIHICTT